MGKPCVLIEVDDKTGVWSTDGLPMLYMPRHFFINNHHALEQDLGRDRYAMQLYDAGFRSAWAWCDHEAREHSISGIDVFHHYISRISQRGWGQFDGSGVDVDTCLGHVVLRNSCFVLQNAEQTDADRLCYLFNGWFPGALAWARGETLDTTNLDCREIECAGSGNEQCIFDVTFRSS